MTRAYSGQHRDAGRDHAQFIASLVERIYRKNTTISAFAKLNIAFHILLLLCDTWYVIFVIR
jgi:hypothetical protein